ncbi:MAG: cytidylate kinase-like family protein [Bryobacteraceae bacterium]
MINILTLEREFGTGAPSIGRTVADRLGWKFWDHEITDEIARRLRCKAETVERHEERLDSMFYRLMKAFMRGSFEARVETDDFEVLDAENLSILFEKVIAKIAAEGKCVIVGRGAPWFLRGREDVFHVFLYAPHDEKLRRVMAAGKNRREAEHLLETVDRDRAAFVCKYYNKVWPDRYLYNMMLNVSRGDEYAVETILHGMKLAQPASTPVSPSS